MSQNSEERVAFKALRAKISGMILNEEELKDTTDTLKDLAKTATDQRVRHHSCETLRANHLKAVDQSIHMEEIENPPKQKMELNLPPAPSELVVRVIGSKEEKRGEDAADKR